MYCFDQDNYNIKKMKNSKTTTHKCVFVFQTYLDESQIDAGFKSLFRQLAGSVSASLRLREDESNGLTSDVCLTFHF